MKPRTLTRAQWRALCAAGNPAGLVHYNRRIWTTGFSDHTVPIVKALEAKGLITLSERTITKVQKVAALTPEGRAMLKLLGGVP